MNNIKKSHDKDQKFLNKIAFLESKQRERILPPEVLIDEMPIHENHTLLDIGAGSGFFTIPMAKKTKETVYALDFDSRMLNVISEKAIKEDLQNIPCFNILKKYPDKTVYEIAAELAEQAQSKPKSRPAKQLNELITSYIFLSKEA